MDTKTCCTCHETKLSNEFSPGERKKDNPRGMCKMCVHHYGESYKKRHREELVIKHRLYNNQHKDEISARRKLYNQQHKEERKIAYAKYVETHRDIVRESRRRGRHARRARERGSAGTYTREEWNSLCEKCRYSCLKCGKNVKLEPDHIVPLARGGTNFISNIQPLCHDCNFNKMTNIVDYRPEYCIL
jgi:5-methylcytosine-specific restriction endonuclease McrA